jgi:hypothetical protein
MTRKERTRRENVVGLSRAEIDAAAHVGALLRKTARQMLEVSRAARALWPRSKWPTTEKEVAKMVGKHLRKEGVLAVSASHDDGAGLSAGVYERKGAALLGVWVWSRPERSKLRSEIVEQAARGELSASWARSTSKRWVLAVETPLGDLGDEQDAMARWCIDRIGELARAGTLEVLSRAGRDELDESRDDVD